MHDSDGDAADDICQEIFPPLVVEQPSRDGQEAVEELGPGLGPQPHLGSQLIKALGDCFCNSTN